MVGDVSSGKSTVLNRFAQIDFSAADEDLCTRRPIRLRLRPLSSGNRERFMQDQLEAICSVEDRETSEQINIDFKTSDNGVGRQRLKEIVGERIGRAEYSSLSTPQEWHDSKYMEEELIITVESDEMIHFDLIDLPGIENDSPYTTKLIKKCINKATYRHTFVMMFRGADRGDTKMQTSLCLSVIKSLQKEIMDAAGKGDEGIKQWVQQHCLGVLTKLDSSRLPRRIPNSVILTMRAMLAGSSMTFCAHTMRNAFVHEISLGRCTQPEHGRTYRWHGLSRGTFEGEMVLRRAAAESAGPCAYVRHRQPTFTLGGQHG